MMAMIATPTPIPILIGDLPRSRFTDEERIRYIDGELIGLSNNLFVEQAKQHRGPDCIVTVFRCDVDIIDTVADIADEHNAISMLYRVKLDSSAIIRNGTVVECVDSPQGPKFIVSVLTEAKLQRVSETIASPLIALRAHMPYLIQQYLNEWLIAVYIAGGTIVFAIDKCKNIKHLYSFDGVTHSLSFQDGSLRYSKWSGTSFKQFEVRCKDGSDICIESKTDDLQTRIVVDQSDRDHLNRRVARHFGPHITLPRSYNVNSRHFSVEMIDAGEMGRKMMLQIGKNELKLWEVVTDEPGHASLQVVKKRKIDFESFTSKRKSWREGRYVYLLDTNAYYIDIVTLECYRLLPQIVAPTVLKSWKIWMAKPSMKQLLRTYYPVLHNNTRLPTDLCKLIISYLDS